MKHIKVIISEMLESGKYDPKPKVTKSNNKICNETAQALLFAVFANNNKADAKALLVCEFVGEALKYVEHEKTGLISFHDVTSILNGLLIDLTKDINAAEVITRWFIKAYMELDHAEALDFYKMKKYLIMKEDI